VFEMAAPIQSPSKCKVRSVIRFLNAKGERPAEIHRLLLFMVTQRFPHISSPKETSRWEKFDDVDEVQEEDMTWFKGQAADFYDSGIQKLVRRLNKCLGSAGNYVEK
jgi:hypothetical protein